MPKRVDYGDEIRDERQYQDDLNQWKELKMDHVNQTKVIYGREGGNRGGNPQFKPKVSRNSPNHKTLMKYEICWICVLSWLVVLIYDFSCPS